MNIIIYKPVISEKSLQDAAKGIYTFEMKKSASAIQGSKAIEQLFGVHVMSASAVITKGKSRIVGRKRKIVRLGDVKKIRVKLKQGEKIDLFEVGQSQ